LWPFEEVAHATLAMYGMPGHANAYVSAVSDRQIARETYWDGRTEPRGYRSYPETGDRYFDDNCWVGSDLLQEHLTTDHGATGAALQRAEAVFRYIQTGWTTSLPKPGGVRWVDASFNGDRALDSTGGLAKLAVQLYDATGRRNQSYLDWAIQAYNWSKQYLLGSSGLYSNSVRADGTVDSTLWIYNQGIMIGAGVVLQRVTGRTAYLDDATRLADASLAAFGTDPYFSTGHGAYTGRAIFNAIFFRNLLLLYAVTRDEIYRHAMQAYADAVWSDPAVHNATTNLFRLSGESRYSLLDQAAMVQVFALLSWHPSMYARLG
jgi:predicted alpha-1,6-mannanase (GH76 family)